MNSQSERNRALLVVVAHPDDEVLGCGATVALRVRQGWTAHLLVLATGIAGREVDALPSDKTRAQIAALREDQKRAADIVGFASTECLDYPDNRLDTVSRMDLAHAIRRCIDRVRPDLVLTHHPGDYNWDHGRVFEAVLMAARQDPGAFAPVELQTFEVPSATERAEPSAARAFCPNVFVDVGDTLEVKVRALCAYRSEVRPYPHPRSPEAVEALARYRGSSTGVGCAEAFQLVRRVERA